ncbi:SCP2 sterol-binding domain-containing protein [Desulfolucanica intricata]|uniref:SCP2 sterol-binding domain-containing protein n=1 Tax=Desulfolucanica intricata TaxID=1285191 RepID=UPI000836C384|nr:SCP2 sterol-binding domain-containing protein [Desulfolucanica intricata]
MATHQEIRESLQAFLDNYQKNERLKTMNRDWDRIILVRATDVQFEHTISLKNGELEIMEGAPGQADLTVVSDSETLADLFYGDIAPTEPYMNGTLKISGSEDDILRLDFISLMIWGE